MGILGNLMSATGAAYSAFRETMLNANPAGGLASSAFGPGDWCRHAARATRYDLYWGLYQNNAYRDVVHAYAARYKATYGASFAIRHLYNPARRIVDVYAGHLMGGMLDRDAGDGDGTPSALPIATDNPAIRPGIARLWADSNWQVRKEVLCRWGACLGDVGVRIVDDPVRGQVRKEIVHPAHLVWVDFDPQGTVLGYVLRRWMPDYRDVDLRNLAPGVDPAILARPVLFEEHAALDGGKVRYRTFLDRKLDQEWDEPYGFVPLVVVQHENVGLDWGQNCFHGGLSRFLEVDDQASCLGDGNRKDLHAPHLMTGMKPPVASQAAIAEAANRTPAEVAAAAEPGRTDKGFIYTTNAAAMAHSLVHRRQLRGIVDHIRDLNADIEKNFPELLADTGNLGGTVTAEAIRNARQRASVNIQARRVGYFAAEVAANRMALAIGGMRGYAGYEGYGIDDYRSGRLDHQIGHCPVFAVDPLDAIAEDQAFWVAIQAEVAVGVPLAMALERKGWTKAQLAALALARAKEPAPAVPPPNSAMLTKGGPGDE